MTRLLLYLIKLFVFFAALLGLNVERMCSLPPESPALAESPAPSPSPRETASPLPEAAAEPALQRTTPGCPAGQCVVGLTNSVPPRPICGPCRTPVPHTSCPKLLAPGAYVYLNDKPYGQGFDSTVRVHGDPEFCRLIHGVVINDCHLEGWPERARCEMELMHGCPVWQFKVDGGASVHPCVDNHSAAASCDHFGSVEYRDDPQTPTTGDTLATLRGFEGRPLECGLQRDAYGPMAGFFTVAHGIGDVRACKPDGNGCGPWWHFDH